jgi:hypothetical protein
VLKVQGLYPAGVRILAAKRLFLPLPMISLVMIARLLFFSAGQPESQAFHLLGNCI